MSTINETANVPSQNSEQTSSDNSMNLFSNKNLIIMVLLVLVVLSLVGINLLLLFGNIISEITTPLAPAIKGIMQMLGFTTGHIIKNSADLVANTADVGIDIAKGTTHSIGDLLINSANPGIDTSKQVSLTEIINIPRISSSVIPQPVQSSEPTVTSLSSQKPKAGWCFTGDFSGKRGCVEVDEHDKCMSGQIFASQSECLIPKK